MGINVPLSSNDAQVIHRFDIDLPARIYVNGSQVPPISVEGRLTNLGLNTLQFECEAKVPVPSHGVLTFSIKENDSPIELPVDIISRVDVNNSSWLWRSAPRFMIRLSVQQGDMEIVERYQKIVHRFIFGEIILHKT